MKRDPIHEKAIRLIEGGQVYVDGHCVKMKQATGRLDCCLQCEMDSLCRRDSEMMIVCRECDDIIGRDCYLELVTNDKEKKQ